MRFLVGGSFWCLDRVDAKSLAGYIWRPLALRVSVPVAAV